MAVSGDYCSLVGNGHVEHFHCDEFADGTITYNLVDPI